MLYTKIFNNIEKVNTEGNDTIIVDKIIFNEKNTLRLVKEEYDLIKHDGSITTINKLYHEVFKQYVNKCRKNRIYYDVEVLKILEEIDSNNIIDDLIKKILYIKKYLNIVSKNSPNKIIVSRKILRIIDHSDEIDVLVGEENVYRKELEYIGKVFGMELYLSSILKGSEIIISSNSIKEDIGMNLYYDEEFNYVISDNESYKSSILLDMKI